MSSDGQPVASPPAAARARLLPLYAAGFVTAFGAHSIAASLGGITGPEHTSLLELGMLLAVYDGAEVLLKPVFGSLADRIGPRPVLLGGLVAFALACARSSWPAPARPRSGWRASGRALPRRRSPRPPARWSPG